MRRKNLLKLLAEIAENKILLWRYRRRLRRKGYDDIDIAFITGEGVGPVLGVLDACEVNDKPWVSQQQREQIEALQGTT